MKECAVVLWTSCARQKGGSQASRSRKKAKVKQSSEKNAFLLFLHFLLFLRLVFALPPSLFLPVDTNAFLPIDAATCALHRVGVDIGVASLVCGASATTKGDNDNVPKLALINPNDLVAVVARSSSSRRRLLFLLLLLGIPMGFRGRSEGLRSDHARLCRREQLRERRLTEEREVRLFGRRKKLNLLFCSLFLSTPKQKQHLR